MEKYIKTLLLYLIILVLSLITLSFLFESELQRKEPKEIIVVDITPTDEITVKKIPLNIHVKLDNKLETGHIDYEKNEIKP